MASATQISATEYLSTSYRPDCDLVDGQLIERNTGEFNHANLQGVLARLVSPASKAGMEHSRSLPNNVYRWRETAFACSRTSASSRATVPTEQIITHPPLICIRNPFSGRQIPKGMLARIKDYLDFGVVNIWILDPVARDAYICDRTGLHTPQTAVLEVPNTPISIPLPDLFAELD